MHQEHGTELDKIMQDSCPYNCFIFFQQNRQNRISVEIEEKKQEKAPEHEKKVSSFLWGKGILIALSTKTAFFLRKIVRKKKHFILLALPFVSADSQWSAYIGSQASEHQEQGETGILINTMTTMTMTTTMTTMTMIAIRTMMIAMMMMMRSP